MSKNNLGIGIFIILSLFLGIFFNANLAGAQQVMTHDQATQLSVEKVNTTEESNWLKDALRWYKWLDENVFGSKALNVAIRNALNKIAYDTATWIGSGGKGRQPLFVREGWGEYLRNISDEAAGDFLEQLGRDENFFGRFNLCTPDLALKVGIGMGAERVYRPRPPACTFSQMIKNWQQELKRDDFLVRFQDMFEPGSNDLGIALTIHTGIMEDIQRKKEIKTLEREANKEWIPEKDMAGRRVSPPGWAEGTMDTIRKSMVNHLGEFTGHALTDAANVFLNQLAYTLFQNLLRNIGRGGDTSTKPYNWDSLAWLYDYDASSGSSIVDTKNKFRKIIEPKFNVRGDYNILQELTMCPNPTKAGPTNCVITDKFREAIINKLTVGQAIKKGYLNGDAIFGFNADGLEPTYNEGYPYRSMIILRKFRIIPVGWEIAAQYIREHPGDIDGTKSLSDLVACFSSSDEYDGYYASWCDGLVDPNWVLKAPLNYCRREGPGPEIVSSQIVGTGDDSEMVIRRNNNYCADEQTCIKENNDGSCEIYGYCTEERRKWNFGNNSCEPKYNTCQTFRKNNGQTVSYLENTLNYGNCNINNVDCLDYCEDYDYNTGEFTCSYNSGNKLYLDRDAQKCDDSAEGCHGFIRTKAGLGVNLMPNSSFEESDPSWDIICDGNSLYGNCSAHLSSGFSIVVPLFDSLPFVSLKDEPYTFSLFAKGCGDSGEIKISSNNPLIADFATSSLETDNEKWHRFSVSHIFMGGDKVIISVSGVTDVSNSCRIDGIKVERGLKATSYTDYSEQGVVYEKLIPDYLASECYVNPGADYRLKNNYPAVCDNYVRLCNSEEVGCNLFTSLSTGISVPAKADIVDYCPSECVGYNEYLQSNTYFDSQKPEYFIPNTAKQCNAQAVGCDEFTNLDKLDEGGEAKEYFTYLRQCVKPTDPTATCAEFYVWEGSDETGYQLKVLSLKVDDDSDDASLPDPGAAYNNDPAVIEYDYSECNETIYNLPATDPAYNPDCRAFYNKDGEVSYHLYKNTITCSDNCHPYRRTENNIDPNLTDAASCTAAGSGYSNVKDSQFHWDATKNVCYFCKNGGVWNSQHNACIYMAIPEEGESCSANQSGCREYTGNTGNNIKTILVSDFEGNMQNWIGDASISLSNESLTTGGNSILITGSPFKAKIKLGYLLHQNSSYHLNFLAKTTIPAVNLKAYIDNGTETVEFLGEFSLINTDWQIVNLNLDKLNNINGNFEITPNTELVIYGDNDFYLDDVRLVEIVDRYYLIKDSWQTPESCFRDLSGTPVGPLYNLGCDIYQDQNENTYYLRRFSQLCQESAVGCELMIDTHNYTPFEGKAWNDGGDGSCDSSDGDDCVKVSQDNFVFAVYDPQKFCNKADIGCQKLGQPFTYGEDVIHREVYLKNNPDNYDQILCNYAAKGCEEWVSGDGLVYFKDPGDMTCEWRQKTGEGIGESTWGWYKKKIKRCDDGKNGGIAANGIIETDVVTGAIVPREDNICLNASDCNTIGLTCAGDSDCSNGYTCVDGKCHYACILDDNDYECPVIPSPDKTIGYGGLGSVVYQPSVDASGNYWVGICPASEAGCTEYIDPISRFSPNIVFNADFSQDVDNNNIGDGWKNGQQYIKLEPNTLYIVSVTGNTVFVFTESGNDAFRVLDDNNRFSSPTSLINISSAINRQSRIFYTSSNIDLESVIVGVTNETVGSGPIEIKKAIVDYQLKQKVDSLTCNGVVNFSDGCVLFNQRDQSGFNLSPLVWDADSTYAQVGSPVSGTNASERDANTLLKVNPDRICSKWLACRSFVKDEETNSNICFDIGLCDSFDDNGNCNNFIVVNPEVQAKTSLPAGTINNMSGYVKVGYNNNDDDSYYPLGAMKQVGEIVDVPNGNFEIETDNDYPLGWTYPNGKWDPSIFKTIGSPVEAQKEGIRFAPEGKQFLKLGYKNVAESEYIEVEPSTTYNLSLYVNTLNLLEGKAVVRVLFFDANHLKIDERDVISLENSYKWTEVSNRFAVGASIQRIKIRLLTNSAHSGVAYFDDIRIKPALKVRNDKYVAQSCRLYPKDDSLSCDYYEDSGLREKGWLGYCLEHDRHPGSEDACLMWYPIDKVKGDGIEEGAGYNGKMPLYYCMQFKSRKLSLVEKRNSVIISKVGAGDNECSGTYCRGCGCCESGECCCPDGYDFDNSEGDGGWGGTENEVSCTPKSSEESSCSGWYYYNGDLQNFGGNNSNYNEADYGVKLCDEDTGELFDIDDFKQLFYCLKIVEVVSPTGQNKYWANKVFEGTDYVVSKLNYKYPTKDKPFSSIIPPEPVNNLYNWDKLKVGDVFLKNEDPFFTGGGAYSCTGNCGSFGLCNVSREMCYSIDISTCSDAINPASSDFNHLTCPVGETCETPFPVTDIGEAKEAIKRMFAQSYGIWEWDETSKHYIPVDREGWEPPNEVCAIEVSQPSWSTALKFPTAFTTNETASEFYNYTNASFNNPSFYSFIQADRSELFVHYSLKTGKMSVVFFHDYPNSLSSQISQALGTTQSTDPDGGQVNFTFTDISEGNILAVKDDPGVTGDTVTGGKDEGSEIEAGDTISWAWAPCCTDGGMIEMPNSSWSITISPSFVSGITGWVFLYTGNNGIQQTQTLSMSEPVTLSFNDYCAIVPEIKNIKVDNSSSLVSYKENEFINLTFNTYVGPAQLPLVMYTIDWGDNEKTVVSGIEMNSRPNIDKPHSLYHLYSYWDMLSKKSVDQSQSLGGNTVYCGTAGNNAFNYDGVDSGVQCPSDSDCCVVKPKIKIKDNWGWCNQGTSRKDCVHWDEFSSWVMIVK